jgi:hypothetical protein
MEPTASFAPSVEIKVSRPEYGPARRTLCLQANETVKARARDYQERQMAHHFKTVAGIWDKWPCTQTNSPHNVRAWVFKGRTIIIHISSVLTL